MTEKIHIAFCCDDNYVGFALLSMTSILTYHPHGGVVFHLVHPGLCEEAIRRFDDLKSFGCFDIAFHLLDPASFQSFWQYHTPLMYRLWLPRLCPDVDRIIYLDCDTLSLRDIQDLWDIDLQGHMLGAVGDRAGRKIKASLSIPPEHYFNSGVMSLNLKKLRETDGEETLRKAFLDIRNELTYIDQDLLNYCYKDDMVLLPQNWNFIHSVYRNMPVPGMYTVDEVEDAIRHPGIVHFTGSHKPWKMWKTTHHPFAGAFWHFAMKAPIDPAFKRKMWWKRLLTGRFKDAKCERPWNQSMIYQGWREA